MTPAFKAKYANVTILDFIAMLKANSGELTGFGELYKDGSLDKQRTTSI
jgi:hypothetical protein